jgi:hypothetical protein
LRWLREAWDEYFSRVTFEPLARTVAISESELTVGLRMAGMISVPLSWFPRLLRANARRASEVRRFSVTGEGIHWPDADEDVSVEGWLAGNRSRGAA